MKTRSKEEAEREGRGAGEEINFSKSKIKKEEKQQSLDDKKQRQIPAKDIKSFPDSCPVTS